MFSARKLIRDARTREWFTGTGFAADLNNAVDVQTFAQAQRLCREHKDRALELVIYFPDREEVAIPLDDE